MSEPSPPRRRWATALSWLLLVAIVALGLAVLDVAQVGAALARAELAWVGAALVLRAALMPLDAWVQQGHLRRLGCDLPLSTMLRVEAATAPLQLVVPAKAGALSKPAWLARQRDLPLATGVGFLVVYKLVSLAGSLTWIGLALAVAGGTTLGPVAPALGLALALAALAGLVLGGGLARRVPAGTSRLQRLAASVVAAAGPLDLPGARRIAAPMFLVQAGQLVASWLCFRAVGLDLPLLVFTWRFGLAAIAGGLPGTPAGVGSRELVAALVMTDLAAPEAVVAATLLATTVAQAWPALLGLPLVPRFLRELGRR